MTNEKSYEDLSADLLSSMVILRELINRTLDHVKNRTNERLEYTEIKMLKNDISDVVLAAGRLENKLDNKLIDNIQSDIGVLNNHISSLDWRNSVGI